MHVSSLHYRYVLYSVFCRTTSGNSDSVSIFFCYSVLCKFLLLNLQFKLLWLQLYTKTFIENEIMLMLLIVLVVFYVPICIINIVSNLSLDADENKKMNPGMKLDFSLNLTTCEIERACISDYAPGIIIPDFFLRFHFIPE